MCLKIQTPWPMPVETGRIGKRILEEHDPYRLIGDQLFEKWREEEFADLYSREGKPIDRQRKRYREACDWIGSMLCTCHWRTPDLISVF